MIPDRHPEPGPQQLRSPPKVYLEHMLGFAAAGAFINPPAGSTSQGRQEQPSDDVEQPQGKTKWKGKPTAELEKNREDIQQVKEKTFTIRAGKLV